MWFVGGGKTGTVAPVLQLSSHKSWISACKWYVDDVVLPFKGPVVEISLHSHR